MQAIADYHRAADQREQQIAQLPNQSEVRVLILRYCHGKDWNDVANELGYTWRHTLRIHGDALQSFADKYKDVI